MHVPVCVYIQQQLLDSVCACAMHVRAYNPTYDGDFHLFFQDMNSGIHRTAMAFFYCFSHTQIPFKKLLSGKSREIKGCSARLVYMGELESESKSGSNQSDKSWKQDKGNWNDSGRRYKGGCVRPLCWLK